MSLEDAAMEMYDLNGFNNNDDGEDSRDVSERRETDDDDGTLGRPDFAEGLELNDRPIRGPPLPRAGGRQLQAATHEAPRTSRAARVLRTTQGPAAASSSNDAAPQVPPASEVADSVPIVEEPTRSTKNRGFMKALALFLLFLFARSGLFIDNVLAGFGGAVSGREPTVFGSCVQGVLFVMMVAVINHLINKRII